MKKYTKVALPAFLIAFSVMVIFSCSKYGENSGIILSSKTARLTGEWELGSFEQEDESDGTTEYMDLQFSFEKDGAYIVSGTAEYTYTAGTYTGGTYTGGTYTTTTIDQEGTWEWSDDKEFIEVSIDGDQLIYTVLKLTNEEMKLIDEYQNEFSFTKK